MEHRNTLVAGLTRAAVAGRRPQPCNIYQALPPVETLSMSLIVLLARCPAPN
jgi:hypothetical protein